MIKIIEPHITEEDIQAVNAVMLRKNINDGAVVKELEEAIGDYHNCYCVMLSNCTLAMELLCKYMKENIHNLDGVSIPNITMISTYNAAYNTKYHIHIKPVDHRNLLLDDSYGFKLAVNFNGRIWAFGNRYNNYRITDSAQSLLSKGIMDDKVTATAFSLSSIKNITAGIGGGILTKDQLIYEYLKEFKNYGRNYIDPDDNTITSVGSNYKISDINAALALSQWKRKEQIIEKKWWIYDQYKFYLGDKLVENIYPQEVPWLIEAINCDHEYWIKNPFRSIYKPLTAYTHIICSVESYPPWGYCNNIFLPSYLTITKDEIKSYSELFLEGINESTRH